MIEFEQLIRSKSSLINWISKNNICAFERTSTAKKKVEIISILF